MKSLNEKIKDYSSGDYYPFHMPGHKRNMKKIWDNPFFADITEIDGFDNLHHPTGVIEEAQKRAARLYHTLDTYFLVNGSTAGLLAAVSAAVSRGGQLLMARNCHKAVYHAAYLRGIDTRYLYPGANTPYGMNGSILPSDVERALVKNPLAEAVLITSPTYDGVVSDIAAIAKIVHSHGIPLIVDEAHGAHFPFCREFPVSALQLGADVVIHSVHKTMPSLTQTALLHRNSERVSRESLRRFFGIYQSSSPSYLLMGSIDACMELMEEEGVKLFNRYIQLLAKVRERLARMKHLRLVLPSDKETQRVFSLDPTKLIIETTHTSLTGKELYAILRDKYHLQMEMATESYVLALTSVMDTKEGFDRLCSALEELDDFNMICEKNVDYTGGYLIENIKRMNISEATEAPWREVLLKDSAGFAAAEYFYLYPPGVPLLVPGEVITAAMIEKIEHYKRLSLDIQGPADYSIRRVRCVEESNG